MWCARSLLFLFLVVLLPSFAQGKGEDPRTYSQTEIDLKLQLLEQKIGTLTNVVSEHKVCLNEGIAR